MLNVINILYWLTFGLCIRFKTFQNTINYLIHITFHPVSFKPGLELCTADEYFSPDLEAGQSFFFDIVSHCRHRNAAELREGLQIKVLWLYVLLLWHELPKTQTVGLAFVSCKNPL